MFKPVDRDRDLSGPVELRIHGVGNSPPEEFLEHSAPVQVAGDAMAGFYRRPASEDGAEALEAYSWGGLTSRGSILRRIRRALWVVLLPFALINAARWMAGPQDGVVRGSRSQRLLDLLRLRVGYRLIAYFATLFAFAWIYSTVVELIALNCVPRDDCVNRVGLGWLPSSVTRDPAQLVAIAVAPVLLVLVAVCLLSQRPYRRVYSTEAFVPDEVSAPDAGAEMLLGDLRMWDDDGTGAFVRRTAYLHAAGAVAIVGMLMSHGVVSAASSEFSTAEASTLVRTFGVVLTGLIGLVLVLDMPVRSPRRNRLAAAVAVGTLVYLAWGVGVAWGAIVPGEPIGQPVSVDAGREGAITLAYGGQLFSDLYGSVINPINNAALVVFLAGAVISALLAFGQLVALVRGVVKEQRLHPDWLGGFGSLIVVLTGVLMMVIFVLGTAVITAFALDIALSGEYVAAPVVLLGLLAYVAFWVGAVRFVGRFGRRARTDALHREWWSAAGWNESKSPARDGRWLVSIDKKRVAVGSIGWTVQAAWGLPILAAIGTVFYVQDPSETILWLTQRPSSLLVAAAVVAALLAALLGLTVYNSWRNVAWAREVGRVWDTLTFWPQWGHPFAPPSYVPRVLDDINRRVESRLAGPVVLAAHSQGSVIAVTALLRMSAETRSRVALLTFGSPLGGVYRRSFNDYFDRSQMERASALLQSPGGPVRWRNVVRITDPITAPIFVPARRAPTGFDGAPDPATASGVDVFSPDPYPSAPRDGDPMPAALGHSGYWADPPYHRALGELWEMLGDRR